MERMVLRPIGPSLAIDSHQPAPSRFRRISSRQARQRVWPVEVQLQPERKALPCQDAADDFQAIGPGRVFVGVAIKGPAHRAVGQLFRQNHGRSAAISQVPHQVLGGGQGRARRDRRRRVPGRSVRSGTARTFERTSERASGRAAERGKLIQLGQGHGPETDLGLGAAVRSTSTISAALGQTSQVNAAAGPS